MGAKQIILTLFASTFYLLSSAVGDMVRIYTDRDIYTSGSYTVINAYTPVLNHVYVSLNQLDGKLIKGVKLSVENRQAHGCIYLPDSLRSGSYLVVLNASEYQTKPLFCKEVFVLSRFENQNKSLELKRADLPPIPAVENTSVIFAGLDSVYHQREKVNFTVHMDGVLNHELEGGLSVCVSKYCPGWQSTYLPAIKNDTQVMSPSLEGVLLRGKVINKYTLEPVSQATVYFSISDSIPCFDYAVSGSDGSFSFRLDKLFGAYEVLLQATKSGATDSLKLSIEEPDNCEGIQVNTKTLLMDRSLQTYFSNTIAWADLKKVYQFRELQCDTVTFNPLYPFPFYGKDVYRIDPKQYLELPDFKSISRELIPHLRFRENNGQIQLRMLNRDFSEFFQNEPFVLIDGVPLTDYSLLNNLGSKQIDWIDVVPFHRYFGDLDFEGVLSIFTKDRNSLRVQSSDRIIRLNFEALQQDYASVTETMNDKNSPQFRQLLLWQPHLNVEESVSLEFRTSDMKGYFQVLLTGRKKNGEIFESREYFRVIR